jgi:hypothetical protein
MKSFRSNDDSLTQNSIESVDDIEFLANIEKTHDHAARAKLFVNVTFLNVILHVCILWLFLTVFFIYFASKLSENLLNGVFKNSTDTLMDAILGNLTPEEATNLYDFLGTHNLSELLSIYQQPSDARTINNVWDEKFAFSIAGGLLLMFIVTSFVFKVLCRKELSIWQVMIENAIMFIFVGIIEFAFFKYIASRYCPVVPSMIVTQLISQLKSSI